MTDLKMLYRIHFIGIGGAGMSAIAKLMFMRGKRVSGSDIQPSAEARGLEKAGAHIAYAHDAQNIPPDAEAVIYTVAVDEKNPELAEAKKRGLPLFTYAEFLGLVSGGSKTIAISGTHGKTSTTGMIARIVRDAGLDPSVIVGGMLRDFGSNCVAGRGDYFIVEACEYRRSFLNLDPRILVITNIDNDHLDYYTGLADIQSAFCELAGRLKSDDVLVCDPADPVLVPVVQGLRCSVVDYTAFIAQVPKLQVPGAHMLRNAASALAVADAAGIDRVAARSALEKFSGVLRRFEYKGKMQSGAEIYDDYAHHPSEIRATLQAARERFPSKRIHVIFQPHLYSRTKLLLDDFAASFGDADEVVFIPIYAAREAPDPDISSERLAEAARAHHPRVIALGSFDDARRHFADAGAADVIFTMGAGDVFKAAEALVATQSANW
ncbi:MAG: UDP-N-acetylmuramate--L-alanine ligase [Candidatus Niyogibacteria bacterium]|nr:UDP-N-acetylmuramate--L-alanine ligase [Candidatus Niyogibacteria bacterium]